MPAKYRRLIRELSVAEDPVEIIKLTARLVIDIGERVKQTPGLEGEYPDIKIHWFLRSEHDDLYEKLDLRPFEENWPFGIGRKKTAHRWKAWYRTTIFR